MHVVALHPLALFQRNGILLFRPPTPVYSFAFTSGLCRIDVGGFLSLSRPPFGCYPSAEWPNHDPLHLDTLIRALEACHGKCDPLYHLKTLRSWRDPSTDAPIIEQKQGRGGSSS